MRDRPRASELTPTEPPTAPGGTPEVPGVGPACASQGRARGSLDGRLVLAPSNDFEDDEPRVRDTDLAIFLGFAQPAQIRELISRHSEALGVIRTVRKTSGPQGGRPAVERWLTQEQCCYLAVKSETPRAIALTKEIIAVFMKARRGGDVSGPALAPARLVRAPFCASGTTVFHIFAADDRAARLRCRTQGKVENWGTTRQTPCPVNEPRRNRGPPMKSIAPTCHDTIPAPAPPESETRLCAAAPAITPDEAMAQCRSVVFHHASRYARAVPRELFDEIVNEGWKAVFVALAHWRPELGPLASYAFIAVQRGMSRFVAKEYRRGVTRTTRATVRRSLDEDVVEGLTLHELVADEAADEGFDAVEAANASAKMRGALDKLAPRDRRAVEMLLDGHTFAEIRAVLGIGPTWGSTFMHECARRARDAASGRQPAQRKNTDKITHEGQSLTLAEWSRVTGIAYSALYARLQKGWSVGDTLTKPSMKRPGWRRADP